MYVASMVAVQAMRIRSDDYRAVKTLVDQLGAHYFLDARQVASGHECVPHCEFIEMHTVRTQEQYDTWQDLAKFFCSSPQMTDDPNVPQEVILFAMARFQGMRSQHLPPHAHMVQIGMEQCVCCIALNLAC